MNIRQTENGNFMVESASHAGQFYTVRIHTKLDSYGSMYFVRTCDCPSRKHPCKHIDAVEQFQYEREMEAVKCGDTEGMELLERTI